LTISPIGYGVPDPTAGSFTEEERRAALSREIQSTISRFEPRLSSVKVHLHRNEGESIDRVLRLRIEAVLRTDPVPEHISFETVVRPTTLDVAVREA
jgi:type VI secretion system protein ImpF